MVNQGNVYTTRGGYAREIPCRQYFFILVMDVLNSLFAKAEEDGLLQPLSQREAKFWISLYTDDVALFLPPVPEGLQIKKAPLSKKRG
jgi:hypothetical protein